MNKSNQPARAWTAWFEIPAVDIKRAIRFYESIFEIEINLLDLGGLKMGIFPHGDVGCALCQHEAYVPSKTGVLVYMNANPDLDVILSRIEKAGGSIVRRKTHISPEQGFMALFTDTEGNRLALHSDR